MQAWILLGALIALVLLAITYNRIVALRQARKNAFSDIDVQLKLRYDLIPNLVETVKGYAAHEKGVLESVTAARASAMKGGTMDERAKAETALGAAMMNVLAVSENYPQLKANDNFRALQDQLTDIENKIAAARRYFNNATSEYNACIQQFPAVLIAKAMGAAEEPFFGLDAPEQQAVKAAPMISFKD